eukprot:COSAG03_NODE_5204_length_1315_cov_474.240132_1_plen_173_part_00
MVPFWSCGPAPGGSRRHSITGFPFFVFGGKKLGGRAHARGAHGAGSAPGRRRVSWRAGRCRGAPRLTELCAPRPVALAAASASLPLCLSASLSLSVCVCLCLCVCLSVSRPLSGQSGGLRCTARPSGVSLHLPSLHASRRSLWLQLTLASTVFYAAVFLLLRSQVGLVGSCN